MNETTAEEFDGCNRDCSEGHTYAWGRCELGIQPPPSLSYARPFTNPDGERSVGFDSVLLERLVPWTALLPVADQHEMLNEFFDANDIERDSVLVAWRTTAERLADPGRRDVLLGEFDPSDYVEAERPAAKSGALSPDMRAMISMATSHCSTNEVSAVFKDDDATSAPIRDAGSFRLTSRFDAAGLYSYLHVLHEPCRGEIMPPDQRDDELDMSTVLSWMAAHHCDASSAATQASVTAVEPSSVSVDHDAPETPTAALSAPEIRFVRSDGRKSEFDLHNGPCDCQRQQRTGDGPWLAAGGWIPANAWPTTLPTREQVERQGAHTSWSETRDRRMASADAQAGFNAARSSFWDDLNRDMRDPEFRDAFDKTTAEIEAFDDRENDGGGPFRDHLRGRLMTAGTDAAERWLAVRASRRMSDVNWRRLTGQIINALWDEIETSAIGMAEYIADARDAADLVFVASILDGVDHHRAWLAEVYGPDVPAPDPAQAMYRRAHELECRFGKRLERAGRPNTWGAKAAGIPTIIHEGDPNV